MNILKIIGVCSYIMVATSLTQAQETPKGWSLFVTGGNIDFFGTTFKLSSLTPFHNVGIRPKVGLGVSYVLRSRAKSTWRQDLKLSFANDTYTENQYSLETSTLWQRRLWKGLYIAPHLGVGLQRAYASDIVYAYQNERWESVNNPAQPVNRTSVNIGLDLGYIFNNKVDLFVGRSFGLVFPYLPNDIIPLAPYSETRIGCRYKIR